MSYRLKNFVYLKIIKDKNNLAVQEITRTLESDRKPLNAYEELFTIGRVPGRLEVICTQWLRLCNVHNKIC